MIVGLIGVLIVVRPGAAEFTFGHLIASIGAFAAALNSIIVRRIGRDERDLVLLLFPLLGSFLAMGALMPFGYRPMPLHDLVAVAVLSGLGFVALNCMIGAYKSGEAAIVAPMQYSQIIWAMLYGMLIFNEKPERITLVFCATQDHTAMIRDLINRRSGDDDPFHCVRVTADDGALGEQHLRAFQDNDKTVPAILTTSRKLSTGVDARNVRNIALLRPVNSMIEFKQIVGRGTRLHDGKDYFTIYDFVKAHERFNDPDWDGEPADPADPPARPDGDGRGGFDETPPLDRDDDDDEPPRRIEIKLADGKERTIRRIAATSFRGPDGRPMSAADFIEKLFGDLPELFRDEDELRGLWRVPETRKRLLDELGERGYGEAQLAGIRKLIDAERSDLFDVLAYIAFALTPVTRRERVARRRDRILSDHDGKLRAFIDFVLAQYVKEGVGELDRAKLSPLLELKYGAVGEGAAQLGDADKIRAAFIGFQRHLY